MPLIIVSFASCQDIYRSHIPRRVNALSLTALLQFPQCRSPDITQVITAWGSDDLIPDHRLIHRHASLLHIPARGRTVIRPRSRHKDKDLLGIPRKQR